MTVCRFPQSCVFARKNKTKRRSEETPTRFFNFAGYIFFCFSAISLIAILPVVTKDLPISPRFTPFDFLSRCKFSTLTTRRPPVEFYLLTFSRFTLRKKEHKSCFDKNRTHDFRTSRCAGYLLDHSAVTTAHSECCNKAALRARREDVCRRIGSMCFLPRFLRLCIFFHY